VANAEDETAAAVAEYTRKQAAISVRHYQKELARVTEIALSGPVAQPTVRDPQRSLNFRSELQKQICAILMMQRDATDLEVCRELDRSGFHPTGKAESSDPDKNLFEAVYLGRDKKKRNLIEKRISEVRRRMRDNRLPVP
jgi:hypothetical protein